MSKTPSDFLPRGQPACVRTGAPVLAAALLGLLAAAPARAADPPLQCTTDRGGNWTITATGPTSVECPEGGECTSMEYQIVSNAGRSPGRAAILVERDAVVVSPESVSVSPPCEGDRRTRLGLHDCSRQTVRFDLGDGSASFQIVVAGTKAPSQSSIVIRRGTTEQCQIAALGIDHFDPHAEITTNEQIEFKGCTVSIPTDRLTGMGGTATISGKNCVFVANAKPVSSGELLINGKSVGNLTLGEGYISSGKSSCTTKVLSNRLYTWCTCADGNGDGIPDDPKPPCPATL